MSISVKAAGFAGCIRKASLAALALYALMSPANAAEYRPAVLHELGSRVEQAVAAGARPVVVFDLDDTLINSRERTLRIIRELSADGDVQRRYPGDARALANVGPRHIRYELADTFARLGIQNADLLSHANDFWFRRFFSNDYCAHDRPIYGAVSYVNWLAGLGARIVYLTGRDSPNMEAGTRYNLTRSRFPMEPGRTFLFMKPDFKMDDTEFKKMAFGAIARLGEVVGVFENEPRNINALHAGFPEAIAVFLDTVHSNKPDVPAPDVAWVQDFREE